MDNIIKDDYIPEQILDIMKKKKLKFEKALEEALKINKKEQEQEETQENEV